MRRFTRFLVCSMFVAFVGHATASPLRIDEPGGASPNPGNYLPENTSEQSLISYAQGMPAVQIAMGRFQSRGYFRESSMDRAGQSDASTLVGLAYSVPGHPEVGAVIWVATRVENGAPVTVVSGGLYEIDPETHARVASSLMAEPQHAAFEVNIGDMSKTDPSNYGFRDAVTDVVNYLMCVVTLCSGCLVPCAGLLAPPASVTCAGVCCIVMEVACLIAVLRGPS